VPASRPPTNRSTLRCWGATLGCGVPGSNEGSSFWIPIISGKEACAITLFLGNGWTYFADATDAVDGTVSDVVAAYAVQSAVTAVIFRDGTTKVFGVNLRGGLGLGYVSQPRPGELLTPAAAPPLVANALDASELFVDFTQGAQWNSLRTMRGAACVCGITNAGRLKCWGDGAASYCSQARPADTAPLRIAGVPIVATAATLNVEQNAVTGNWYDYSIVCVAGPAASEVVCVGSQLGSGPLGPDDHNADPGSPVVWRMPGGARIAQVVSESRFGSACALTEDRSIVCWGRGDTAQQPGFGDCPLLRGDAYMLVPCVVYNSTTDARRPALTGSGLLVGLSPRVRSYWGLFEADARIMGLTSDGGVVRTANMSDSTRFDYPLQLAPLLVDSGAPNASSAAIGAAGANAALGMASGRDHVCVVLADRSVSCWGRNMGVALT